MSETKKDQNWENPRKIYRNPKSISTFTAVLQIWAALHERQIRESYLKSSRSTYFSILANFSIFDSNVEISLGFVNQETDHSDLSNA